MKANVLSMKGKSVKDVAMPAQFSEPFRPDLIRKVFTIVVSHDRQPYGVMPRAGINYSGLTKKRRQKNYRASYGHGMSRVPRKVMARIGGGWSGVLRFRQWVGTIVPQAVGGRKAHPPIVEKVIYKEVSVKERRKAIRSAIAATAIKDVVIAHGHLIKDSAVPFVMEDAFESISKSKEVIDVLNALGLDAELERCSERKVRAGKGKMRGRKYKTKKGPLIITSKRDAEVMKAARNVAGLEVIPVTDLNIKVLAPGASAGRLVVWTEGAIKKLGEDKLFGA